MLYRARIILLRLLPRFSVSAGRCPVALRVVTRAPQISIIHGVNEGRNVTFAQMF